MLSTSKTLPYTHHLSYGLAGLIGVSGLGAYIVRRSVVSLIASSGYTAAYFYSGHLAEKGEYKQANAFGLGASALFSLQMGRRFTTSRSIVPLALSSLGIAAAVIYSYQLGEILAAEYEAKQIPA